MVLANKLVANVFNLVNLSNSGSSLGGKLLNEREIRVSI